MTDGRGVSLAHAALRQPAVCPDCGASYWNHPAHAEECRGRPLTVTELAQRIVDGEAFADVDAVTVAGAYLELLARTRA